MYDERLEHPERARVVVAGAGVAALEAVLSLHDLAPAQVDVTVIAPETTFVLRPLDVARSFARGHSTALDLDRFMREHGGRFRHAAVTGVDAEHRVVHCATGPDEPYDVLIVAVGAISRPAFEHVQTFGAGEDSLLFDGLLADIDEGYTRSVGFVVPAGNSWPLPLYELALMTAEEAWSAGIDDIRFHFVTPEQAPLEIFGPYAGAQLGHLLSTARISLHPRVEANVDRNGHIDTGFGMGIEVERIVALPMLDGPTVEGLPADEQGFVPVDSFGRVVGVDRVYAVGDAANHPIKQGGLACQQADVAVAHLAATVGVPIDVVPYRPVLRGRLLTGNRDRFLRRDERTGASDVADAPLWWPPAKVSGYRLAPYLESRGLVTLLMRDQTRHGDVEVQMQLDTPTTARSSS